MKEIINRYESGESVISLMKRFHMGQKRIERIIGKDRLRNHKEALEMRNQTYKHPSSPSPEMIERVKELYLAENSCVEVEGKTGVCRITVHKIVKAAGISRSVEEAKAIARRKGRLRDWGYSPKRNELVSVLLDECA